MWTGPDSKNGITAMARVTSSSAAVAARLLAQGKIKEKGIVTPEEAFQDEAYSDLMRGLERRGIAIVEKIKPVQT